MWFATSEEHSFATVKLVNTASGSLKLAILERFWLAISVLNNFTREQPFFQLYRLELVRQKQFYVDQILILIGITIKKPNTIASIRFEGLFSLR